MQSSPSSGPNTLTKRPTTPKSKSTTPVQTTAPPLPEIRKSKDKENEPPKRSSLGFLRRSKSGDRDKNARPPIPEIPPQLPALFGSGSLPPPIRTFGGEGAEMRDSVAIVSGKLDIPPAPQHASGRQSSDVASHSKPSSYQESLDKTESMTNRGRYSYASTAMSAVNGPRRVRRRRDPTPFNILLIGASGSGKTEFIEFLRQSLVIKKKSAYADQNGQSEDVAVSVVEPTTGGTFTKTYVETEIEGERIGVTLWDSASLEQSVVDLQLREIAAFIESKFEETFSEETKVVRAPGVRDTHIHCTIHLLDPSRLSSQLKKSRAASSKLNGSAQETCLDEDLDLQVYRALQGKTTIIPVISKADTCTKKHMQVLKHLVNTSIHRAGLNPLEALELEPEPESEPASRSSRGRSTDIAEESEEQIEAESDSEGTDPDSEDDRRPSHGHKRTSSRVSVGSFASSPGGVLTSLIPLSIISPDTYTPTLIGREFPWGFADPYNPDHCDFIKLKEAVFTEWRAELREISREVWYESWRTARLSRKGIAGGR